MPEYWLISVPVERSVEETWKTLNKSVTKIKNCIAYKFYIPPLKVGTLDTLLSDGDDLVKLELYLEGLRGRLVNTLESILDNDKFKKELKIDSDTIHQYLISFKWDTAKFPPKQTIKCLTNLAYKLGANIENELKQKLQDYIKIRTALETLEKEDEGTLLTKNLNKLVTENDFVMDSEFMRTLLVVVNKKMYSEWLRTYERLDHTVIPRSSRVIAEDHENYLIGITLFKERVKQFTDVARKFKFTVRDYFYDENQIRLYEENYLNIKKTKEMLHEPLVKILKHSFSETFKCQVHMKACRLFVESVLRYGLPASFCAAIVTIHCKCVKKMHDLLHHLYKHLDSLCVIDTEKNANLEMLASLGQNTGEYYPYVSYKIVAEIK